MSLARCVFCAAFVRAKFILNIINGKRFKDPEGFTTAIQFKKCDGYSGIDDQLNTFFVLRRILNLPCKLLEEFIMLRGGKTHPEGWVNLCDDCGIAVKAIYEGLRDIDILKDTLEMKKMELRKKIIESVQQDNCEIAAGPMFRRIRTEARKVLLQEEAKERLDGDEKQGECSKSLKTTVNLLTTKISAAPTQNSSSDAPNYFDGDTRHQHQAKDGERERIPGTSAQQSGADAGNGSQIQELPPPPHPAEKQGESSKSLAKSANSVSMKTSFLVQVSSPQGEEGEIIMKISIAQGISPVELVVKSSGDQKCSSCSKYDFKGMESHILLEDGACLVACLYCSDLLHPKDFHYHQVRYHPHKFDGFTPFQIRKRKTIGYRCHGCPAYFDDLIRMKEHRKLHLSGATHQICPESNCGWYMKPEGPLDRHQSHIIQLHPDNQDLQQVESGDENGTVKMLKKRRIMK